MVTYQWRVTLVCPWEYSKKSDIPTVEIYESTLKHIKKIHLKNPI
jgi:hypothetical protein